MLVRVVFERPKSLQPTKTHYCPGCGHGIVNRLVAEIIDELGIRDKTIGVAPVGCSVLAYNYFSLDMQQAAHGRAPAVATGIKRVLPDNIVFCYQGDGDLASIGTAEIVHAAARAENITVIYINNAIYGMTGGQMAPTTVIGQKTATSPYGRSPEVSGYPIKVCEMLSVLDGPVFVARAALTDPKGINNAKKYIRNAFYAQHNKLGFSIVEILSPCPTNWGLSPVDAMRWISDEMVPVFKPGIYKQIEGGKA
ncbi:MAG: 2-oxoglutarate oxidoreductase [Thermoanaerobacterales bacterium]|jgi:2-oxoglutarate ferredoxin oxidoreductase subunit beta|nr:2-oxoglutarate oxidoreductase [Thermoanaerobacterales bacterium]